MDDDVAISIQYGALGPDHAHYGQPANCYVCGNEHRRSAIVRINDRQLGSLCQRCGPRPTDSKRVRESKDNAVIQKYQEAPDVVERPTPKKEQDDSCVLRHGQPRQFRADEVNSPVSWLCVDCGFKTAPGFESRIEMYFSVTLITGGVLERVDDQSEVYHVREAVWKEAKMDGFGGCLCIGCLEKRIGRTLKPKDFDRDHPFANFPGTERLLNRRGG